MEPVRVPGVVGWFIRETLNLPTSPRRLRVPVYAGTTEEADSDPPWSFFLVKIGYVLRRPPHNSACID